MCGLFTPSHKITSWALDGLWEKYALLQGNACEGDLNFTTMGYKLYKKLTTLRMMLRSICPNPEGFKSGYVRITSVFFDGGLCVVRCTSKTGKIRYGYCRPIRDEAIHLAEPNKIYNWKKDAGGYWRS